MKASSAIAALFTFLLCAGCSKSVSPTEPTPATTGSASLNPSAGGASAAVLPTPAAAAVPLKGRLEGSQTITPLDPPFVFVDMSSAGTATILGRFLVRAPHTVNFATRTAEGTYTFTAANGDMLTADFTGDAQGGPVISIEEHATITGGTGRFDGATGSFTVHRTFDPAAGTTRGSFEGTVSTPAAGQ